MCMCILFHVIVCGPHACLVPTESEEGISPLELESQMFVSHHADVGNRTQVFYKNSHALKR